MEEKVGKVVLDYEKYGGQDLYSDGDVEQDILDIVSSNQDYNEAIAKDDRFAVLYHLSKDRQGVAQVMDITKKDSVLEIGAGCGAITGAIAEKAGQVECIELSKRRSLINANRNKNMDNIIIHVGNFQDIEIKKQYDVITLIGVLEYAIYYIDSENPFDDFLQKIKSYLKPEGRLYIAIENRLGIKYLAGASEDHVGIEYEGVLNYPNTNSVRTFTKTELQQLLTKNGFANCNFYYPYPDYKFPKTIYSDECMGSAGEMLVRYSNYGAPRISSFDESQVMASIVGTKEWQMLANSFIVDARLG